MKYEAIQRHRSQYPLRLMCRCLKVSHSGFHDWARRMPSLRAQDNARLLERIRHHHVESDGVMGAPRMYEELGYEGETASLNRVARLMSGAGLSGIPQKRRWRHKPSGIRPTFVRTLPKIEPRFATHGMCLERIRVFRVRARAARGRCIQALRKQYIRGCYFSMYLTTAIAKAWESTRTVTSPAGLILALGIPRIIEEGSYFAIFWHGFRK